MNNPTSVAIHEAKLLWPNKPIQCVISFGTGRRAPIPVDSSAEPPAIQITNSSWKKKFFAIIDSATDTEGKFSLNIDKFNVQFFINLKRHSFRNCYSWIRLIIEVLHIYYFNKPAYLRLPCLWNLTIEDDSKFSDSF